MKSCGDCGLCCKIMGVTALEKPAGRWCRHFGKTTGCAIYEDRPNDCRVFNCLWLLTEALDDAAARQLPGLPCTAVSYTQAWQATGRAPAREEQIRLTLSIGSALDRTTRNRLMRSTLRLMRGPAQAAGLAELQKFLNIVGSVAGPSLTLRAVTNP